MRLVTKHADRWARNRKNLKAVKAMGCHGVYILLDGSTPMYVGRGEIFRRLRRHFASKSKAGYWDHFSWFEIKNHALQKEVEVLLIRSLPFFLRSLNRQRANFLSSNRINDRNPVPDRIKKPHLAPKKKNRSTRRIRR